MVNQSYEENPHNNFSYIDDTHRGGGGFGATAGTSELFEFCYFQFWRLYG